MKHKRCHRRLWLAFLATLALSFSAAVRSAVVTWVGANDSFWDIATNWSSNPAFPGAADDVALGAFNTTFRTNSGTLTIQSFTGTGTLTATGGTLSFANASSIGGFSMSGGQLAGTGDLTINGAATLTNAAFAGAGTTTAKSATTISSSGLSLDGGRIFQNDGTVTQTSTVDLNARNLGTAQAGSGSVVNSAGATWNSSLAAGILFITASSQGAGDTGAGATFTNAGTFNKLGAGTTDVRVNFINNGSVDVQAGVLQFSGTGVLTHNGTLTIAAGATLDLQGGNTITHTINTSATTVAGTISLSGNNFVNFTTAHTISGTGTWQHDFGQVIGADLTFGPSVNVVLVDGAFSGAGTTTVQGTTTMTNTGLRLDGGRIFRNEGTVTQAASVDLNSRRSGVAEAGNGTVVNATTGIWNSNIAAGTNFIFASSQGAGDTGAGAIFTNQGIFNKQGAGLTDVRAHFVNDGHLNVQAGQLQFSAGGRLTHNGVLTIAADAVVDFAGGDTVTHTISTGSTTISGTLSITGDNFVNFTQPHTIVGNGTFQHSFGQVTGSNLVLGSDVTALITDGAHSGAATTTVQGNATISSAGLRLDGGRVFQNEGTVNMTASVDFNSRRSGAAEAGNGVVINAASGTWNSSIAAGTNFLSASNQGGADTGAGANFNNFGTFNKQGAGVTDVRVHFDNSGTLNVQAGQLQFSAGGRLTHNGAVTIAADAVLDFASGNTITQTINTAATTIAGTLSITGDNFVNFTTPHTIGGTGTFQHNFGQVIGQNLTLGPSVQVLITDGAHSGAATTTVQGNATISITGLRLDGGRVFQNEGTVNMTASVDFNSRRSGAAEAGNGVVINAASGTWNSSIAAGTNFLSASNQGGADTGAGANFNNFGTFNKQGAGVTDVRVHFDNSGTLNVQAGQLQFSAGGRLTHNGAVTIAADAVLDFASGNTITQTINTAATTIAGTLSITGDNFVNFTTPHTIGGTGTFQHNFGQVIGQNLTLGPSVQVLITDGAHSGAATTTVQGNATISITGLRLDGGRVFQNEGTVNMTASVDFNSRRSGAAEAGNGVVINAASGTWNSSIAAGTNFLSASNQGGADTGAGANFNNFGTFNKQGAGVTDVRVHFDNSGTLNVQAGQLQFSAGGRLTHNGAVTIAADAVLDFASGNTITQTINTAATTIAGTLSITGDNFVNFTTPHTIGGTGTFQHNFGQVIGQNLTLGPSVQVLITDGAHSGAATTTVQGNATISITGLRLDGGRTFRNEGTVTQTASVDFNSRRSGAAEAGNGVVINAASGTWNSNIAAGTNFLVASSQGVGDTGAGAVFTNAGTFNKQGAGNTDVRVNFSNSGLVDVQAGTLILREGIQGTGTLQTGGGIADLRAASTTGNLFHNTNAPDSLILNTNSITVSSDYNNANFGIGNSFNRRANVQGTGQILAAGNVAQGITGTNVTNGDSATPTLTIGSMHVGSNTFNFQVANTGSTGPSLRGAIQTSGNGANITDPKISVTPQNWGPVAPGAATGNIGVTVNAASAGALSLLPNQQLHIANNFDNVNGQNLIITLAAGAAAYNLAAANVTPSPVTLPNQRVGGNLSQPLTVANMAPAGAFTETLSASFGANTGNVINNGGSAAGIAGGASNSTAMQVGVNTSAAGARSGTVTVNLTSNAAASSGLANTVLTPQVINVSGNVYQAAIGQLNSPIGLNFGTVQVGQVVTQNLSISNIATGAAGFVEDLNARFGTPNGTGAAQIVGTGSITGLAAGAPANTSSMVVSVNSGTAGTINGFIPINFFTAGTVAGVSNGLGEAAANSASFGVTGVIESSGQVVNQASPLINTAQPINLGNVRINAASPTAFVSVTNQATTAPQAALNAAIATASPGVITASGAFNLLAPGQTDSTSLQVGMATNTAGAKSGSATVSFVSDASNIGNCAPNCQLALQSQNVAVQGNVFRLATGNATPDPLNLGNFRLNAPTATGSLAVTNTAAADGFSEQLGIQSVTPTSSLFTATNALGATRVNAQATANNAVTVGLGTGLVAGLNTAAVAIQYLSDGTASGTGAPINSNLQNVTVNATGFNVAAGAAAPSPVTIGNQRIGGTNSEVLTVSNTAPAGSFTEVLNASFGPNTGHATSSGAITGGLGTGGVAGTSSNNTAMSVGVETSAAGARTGTVTLNYASNGAGTSGLAPIGVGSQQITVSGNVYQLAAGTLNTAPLNFGTVQVGQSVSQPLSITNSAVGPSAFVEDLNARFGTATGTGAAAIGGTGQIAGLAAGGTNGTNMVVSVNTASAQAINGSIPVNFFSAGSVNGVSNGLAEVGVGSVQYAVSGIIQAVGNVIDQAQPVINNPSVNLGNVRINAASPSAFVSVTNQATGNPQAALNATIAAAAPITAGGSFDLLGPGATKADALQVGMSTSTAGAVNGSATVSFVSDASNVGNCAPNCQLTLPSQNVSVSGNVYRLANPVLNTSTVTLVARVGDAAPTGVISVTNSSPDAFTEGLKASLGAAPGGFSASGSIGNLAAGATDASTLKATLNTALAGVFAGPLSVSFTSTGEGTTGAADVAVGSAPVGLSGKVYTPALAQVAAAVDFGIVHKGESVSTRNVTVANIAEVSALNDVLRGSFGGASGPFAASGNLAGVAAGAADGTSFSVALNTASAGIFTGSATATLASHNDDMADLPLGTRNVALTAQVNNFANTALVKTAGEGALNRSGRTYTLNLGSILEDSGIHSVALGVLNDVLGPADLLDGNFDLGLGDEFQLAGFNPFFGLQAGGLQDGLIASLDTDLMTVGTYVDRIVLRSVGHNASGFRGELEDIVLEVHGSIIERTASVPEPSTLALLVLGTLILVFGTRRLAR